MPRRIGNPAHRRRHFIKEWRIFRGFTQQQLADLVGSITGQNDIKKSTISRIEDGTQGYSQDSLEAIADALGVHPGVLLTRPPGPADAIEEAPPRRRRA